MADNKTAGIVDIHGKQYQTVAYRVQMFREKYLIETGWSISTQLVSVDEKMVIMKAIVTDPEQRVVATGYAEENRNASQINKTSALENCETSAIGRALAAAGMAGIEYASANEVQNAVLQQDEQRNTGRKPKPQPKPQTNSDGDVVDVPTMRAMWAKSTQRWGDDEAHAQLHELVKERTGKDSVREITRKQASHIIDEIAKMLGEV